MYKKERNIIKKCNSNIYKKYGVSFDKQFLCHKHDEV